MRRSSRQAVVCPSCNAQIFWLSTSPHRDVPNAVQARTIEPPAAIEACPSGSQPVDTTVAYPVLPDFPPKFADLRTMWSGFAPQFELHRVDPDNSLSDNELAVLPAALNSPEGLAWLKQRLFYRSTICFYRALNLFLATLTLQRRSYQTWSDVTAYYSRFYSIQGILNLCLSSHFRHRKTDVIIYCAGQEVRLLQKNAFPAPLKTQNHNSHERWWLLMDAIKHPGDYPVEHLGFVLSRAYYEPTQRNAVNYDFEYDFGGFPELNWCDIDVRNMMAHFSPDDRQDRDITNHDRYYRHTAPDEADWADFASDPIQVVWLSIRTHLELINALGITQSFITSEKVAALLEVHLFRDFPRLTRGILLETAAALNDGFNVADRCERMGSAPMYSFFSRNESE